MWKLDMSDKIDTYGKIKEISMDLNGSIDNVIKRLQHLKNQYNIELSIEINDIEDIYVYGLRPETDLEFLTRHYKEKNKTEIELKELARLKDKYE